MNIRIGTKLAITVGIGVVLVAGMIVNQQLSNTSVARQTELARDEQYVIADLLSASVALQRMQVGTREIRLAISEQEADQALAGLRESMGNAVGNIQAAIQLCGNTENCERLESLVKLAKDYAGAAAEMTALKKDYGDIAKPLEQINTIGTQINGLIERATSDARGVALQRMIAAEAQLTRAGQISIGAGLFVVAILMGAAIFGVLSIGRPIRHIAGVLLQLADGSRGLDIPYTGRGDEVGDAARAARTFRDNLVRLEKLEAEQKEAAARTVAELAGSVSELRALGEVTRAVTSTLDLETVLTTIVAKATQLSGTEAGAIYVFEEAKREFQLRATYGMSEELIAAIRDHHAALSNAVSEAAEQGEPVQVADLQNEPPSMVNDIIMKAGYRARLLVPLVRSGETVGALVVRRIEPGEFPISTIELVKTFAAQSVLAMQNAHLFSELAAARDAADEANRSKSNFLATMSHEIRTPMNGVLGLLELLQKTPLNAEQRELTDVVRESASSLLKIIDDILDFSKIEAGRIEIERVPLSPLTLVEGVADALASQAHKKKLLLATFVDASVPPMVEGDPVRLRQILFNLIGNAIKFTEQGEVTVRMSVDSAAPGGMMLQVQIRDTGIGLTPEARTRLFQPFVQADGSTTRRFGGTGLGLSICRRLVERMGGEIGVESSPGKGSTFRFTMSVAPSTAPAPVEPDLSGLCILAIVDNPSVQDVLKSYLSMAGAQVEISRSADAALALLRRYAAAGIVVDAVIFALQRPATDAIAFRCAVAPEQGVGAKPCLLLTAYDEPMQRGHALDAGFAAYFLMPIRRATLLRGLAEACGRSPGFADVSRFDATTTTAPPPDRDAALAAGQLILVAEDNSTNQLVIARQLAQLGYAADLTDNGRMALDRFRAGHYGLVLTDIHMPEMDGLELTAAIRDLERTEGRARVPILALTADVLVSEAERYLAAGIDDRMRKPMSLAQLEDAMARWLPKAAPPPQAAIAQSSSIRRKVAATEAKILNLEQMRENFGAIDGTIVTLLQRYVESTESLLAEIDRGLAARSAKDVRGAAHSALGASRTAGADELAAILTDLEVAMETKAWDDASALRAQLVPAFTRVKEAVNRIGI